MPMYGSTERIRTHNHDCTDLKANLNDDAEERAIAWAQDEMTRLRNLLDAAVATLQNNLHLCDGENCTLYALLKAVEAIDPNWEEQ